MSARGQEFLRKQGLGKMDAANRTGDDVFHQSLLGATTNASQEYDHSRYNSMRKYYTIITCVVNPESN